MDHFRAKVIKDILDLPLDMWLIGILFTYFLLRGIADTIIDLILIYLDWLLGDTIDDWTK